MYWTVPHLKFHLPLNNRRLDKISEKKSPVAEMASFVKKKSNFRIRHVTFFTFSGFMVRVLPKCPLQLITKVLIS